MQTRQEDVGSTTSKKTRHPGRRIGNSKLALDDETHKQFHAIYHQYYREKKITFEKFRETLRAHPDPNCQECFASPSNLYLSLDNFEFGDWAQTVPDQDNPQGSTSSRASSISLNTAYNQWNDALGIAGSSSTSARPTTPDHVNQFFQTAYSPNTAYNRRRQK